MTGQPASESEWSSRRSLGDDVYKTIKAQIMKHEIPPGGRINIDRLSRSLNVSQTPIRQALARLESDGLAQKEPLVGYSATPILTRSELEQLYTFRLLTEPWAAGQAALVDPKAAKQLLENELGAVGHIEEGASDQSHEAVIAHDARFHDLILSLAGNSVLRAALERTHSHLHLFRLYSKDGGVDATVQEHRDIAAHIIAGNELAASAAMTEHLRSSRERTLREMS